MFFFGIINITLFKYFCDLPSFNSFITSVDMFSLHFVNIDSRISIFDFDCIYTYFIFYNVIDYLVIFNSILSVYFSYIISDNMLVGNINLPGTEFIEVFFQTSSSNLNFVEFCSLQRYIYIVPNETHLVFFRMYNSIMFEIYGVSIYLVYPTDFLIFFNKIQCFCFEELLLYPYETIDLPVVFYVSHEAFNFIDFFYSNKLYLSYLLLLK